MRSFWLTVFCEVAGKMQPGFYLSKGLTLAGKAASGMAHLHGSQQEASVSCWLFIGVLSSSPYGPLQRVAYDMVAGFSQLKLWEKVQGVIHTVFSDLASKVIYMTTAIFRW